MVKKYRKKPVTIEAIQFKKENWDEIHKFTCGDAYSMMTEYTSEGERTTCFISTLEGEHVATEGDFIIKGVHGEFYPCKPDIFWKTYEEVNDGLDR